MDFSFYLMASFEVLPVSDFYFKGDFACFHSFPFCISLLQLGFMLLALIWKFDFPPFMVLIIAILNDG